MAAWQRNALSPGGCWTTHPGPPPGRTSLSTTARRICREEMVSLVGSAVNCLSAKKRPPAAQQQCPLLPWMSWLTHCNCCGGSTSRSASTSTLPAVFSYAAFCCRACLISLLFSRAWCSLDFDRVWLQQLCCFLPSGEKRAGGLLCRCERREEFAVSSFSGSMLVLQPARATVSAKKQTRKSNIGTVSCKNNTFITNRCHAARSAQAFLKPWLRWNSS